MSTIQFTIIHHWKNLKMLNTLGKRQSIDANLKMTQILQISLKEFKAYLIKIIK